MFIKEPTKPALYSMIWMHGLGASHTDMASLQQEMGIEDLPIRHIFLQAPIKPITINNGYQMPAWYDIYGMSLLDREDKQGVLDSEIIIKEAIQKECEKGIQPSRILLSGFSQGGSMALFTGLRSEEKLAGIVVMSGYLPLSNLFDAPLPQEKNELPIFFGYGEHDPLVLPKWTELTIARLKKMGLSKLDSNVYPMEHSVCFEEVKHIRQWLCRKIVV